MKNYLLLLFAAFLLVSCQKENISTPATSSAQSQAGAKINVISSTTTEYYLDFNPYVYCNEFWQEAGKAYGSCFAAAVVIVESHLNGVSSISSTAVKNANASMIKDNGSILDGTIYTLTSTHLKDQLRKDGFIINYVAGYSRSGAINGMINALKNNKWIITIAGYMGGGMGHAYPVHYLKIVKNTDDSINEAASRIKVIDTYGCQPWSTYNGIPEWNKMYPPEFSLKDFLDHMNSAVPGVYSTFEVSR